MNKQIRIYVNGRFQNAITVDQEAPIDQVAIRAHDAMRLSSMLVPTYKPGLINFIHGGVD